MTLVQRSKPVSDPAWTAMSALNLAVAAFDGAPPRLSWRSPAFARLLPALEEGSLPGTVLSPAFDAAARGEPAWVASPDDGTVFEARAARDADDRVWLMLASAEERQEAEGRRLADRERLLLTSRMMSVGEMASMIAHELNQPIGSIANIVRGLRARAARGALSAEMQDEALAKASDQALYAADVIQRIRTFVEQRRPKAEPLALAGLARATLDLLDWEIARGRVEARTALADDLPPVLGDAVMIQQVLVNIARNGLDAMRDLPGPRRLTLAGETSPDGRFVEITVADTGPGVPEDQALRLFSPFASTKSGGMGVGLGICRSIVELHRGRLWHTAAPQGGSVFHIALPVAFSGAQQEEEP